MMLRNQLVLVSACAAFAGAVAQNPWMGLAPCSLKDGVSIYVADQHDGDQKQILRQGTQISIYPFANNQTWVVTAELNVTTCAASINFNVSLTDGRFVPPDMGCPFCTWPCFTFIYRRCPGSPRRLRSILLRLSGPYHKPCLKRRLRLALRIRLPQLPIRGPIQ